MHCNIAPLLHIHTYIYAWMYCIYWMLYGIRNALAKGWKENLISDLNGGLVTCREILYMLDGSAPEWEWVWLRGVGKAGEVQGRGQGWERGTLRAAGWEDQVLGKDCGLEGYCGKELKGRWMPAAVAEWVMSRYLLSSAGRSSHELLLAISGEKQKWSVCGKSCPVERDLKKIPNKGYCILVASI